jgi:Dehydrogenases with different specificities (related to short-chain alcohol dehydrogenases)
MNISLKGKTALVGGSPRGIGLAIARQLANSGASVFLMSSHDKMLPKIIPVLSGASYQKHHFIPPSRVRF